MPISVRLVVAAILLVVASVEAAPAATASSTSVYAKYYNQSIVAFQSLKQVASEHNSYVSTHKGSCGQQPIAWSNKSRKYVAAIKGYLSALWKMNPQQRKEAAL